MFKCFESKGTNTKVVKPQMKVFDESHEKRHSKRHSNISFHGHFIPIIRSHLAPTTEISLTDNSFIQLSGEETFCC